MKARKENYIKGKKENTKNNRVTKRKSKLEKERKIESKTPEKKGRFRLMAGKCHLCCLEREESSHYKVKETFKRFKGKVILWN